MQPLKNEDQLLVIANDHKERLLTRRIILEKESGTLVAIVSPEKAKELGLDYIKVRKAIIALL